MAILLSLDIGTSKLCALALSTKTMLPMAIRSAPNDADVPDLAPGRHEQNPAKPPRPIRQSRLPAFEKLS
jgi:hypothetical protein